MDVKVMKTMTCQEMLLLLVKAVVTKICRLKQEQSACCNVILNKDTY